MTLSFGARDDVSHRLFFGAMDFVYPSQKESAWEVVTNDHGKKHKIIMPPPVCSGSNGMMCLQWSNDEAKASNKTSTPQNPVPLRHPRITVTLLFVFSKEVGVEGPGISPPNPGTDDEGYHPKGEEEGGRTQSGSSSSSDSESGSSGELVCSRVSLF